MKVLTVLGARPQFIKASAVSRAIGAHNARSPAKDAISEVIVHTGQHFDKNMSDVFFNELEIPRPDHQLEFGGLSHGAMTGRMIERIESIIREQAPDWVLVYGDTNSTLAGALAASKLHVPVAHVEAGLRSHNPYMPEEQNRVLADRLSAQLFCPTPAAIHNLEREGYPFAAVGAERQAIHLSGDVMLDVTLYFRERARQRVELSRWNVGDQGYALCTLHRAENTDDHDRLTGILEGLRAIAAEIPVLLPLHPRTRHVIAAQGLEHMTRGISVLDPLGYLEMQRLEMSAKLILTDSGGVQKEAYFHGVPCITLRDQTEWVETVDTGWNHLVGADAARITNAFTTLRTPRERPNAYGDGSAAARIVATLS